MSDHKPRITARIAKRPFDAAAFLAQAEFACPYCGDAVSTKDNSERVERRDGNAYFVGVRCGACSGTFNIERAIPTEHRPDSIFII